MLAVLGPIPAKPKVHIRAERKKKKKSVQILSTDVENSFLAAFSSV